MSSIRCLIPSISPCRTFSFIFWADFLLFFGNVADEQISEKFDFTGTVKFKDNPAGSEGTLYYYLDGSRRFTKTIDETNYNFSYNTDKPEAQKELDPLVYNWFNGLHKLHLKAIAANNSSADAIVNFIAKPRV